MKKIMNQLKSKGGFTLVELMIVLSIIAILAVVLVPKVAQMKDGVRNQGVNANVSSVRATLEMRVNTRGATAALEGPLLITALNTAFVDSNAIVNPMTNGDDIATFNTAVNSPTHSIAVLAINGVFSNNAVITNTNRVTNTLRRGKVVIFVYNDAYAIWGYDSAGVPMPYQLVR